MSMQMLIDSFRFFTRNSWALLIFVFCYHFLFSLLICGLTPGWGNWLTPLYLILTLGVFLACGAQKTPNVWKNLRELIGVALLMHIGVLLGVLCSGSDGSMLWVPDSVNIHVPGAERVAAWLQGEGGMAKSSYYDRTYLAHLIVGFFFALLGVSPIVSSLSLVVPKLLTAGLIFLTARELFSLWAARLASLIYVLLPTGFFYTLVFYKEATVQLLVALMSYLLVRLTKSFSLRSWPEVVGVLLTLVALGNERHYLLPCFALSLLVLVFFSKRFPIVLKGLAIVAAVLGYLLFTAYYRDLNYQSIIKVLGDYRKIFLSYPDVSPINAWLPYPLAFIKLLFSPFFTFSKLQTYEHFATLLTWGSVVYHAVVCLFGWGLFKALREKKMLLVTGVQLTAFVVFLAVFAYVAPYSGRMRDSFLPVISLYAGFGLFRCQCFERFVARLKI